MLNGKPQVEVVLPVNTVTDSLKDGVWTVSILPIITTSPLLIVNKLNVKNPNLETVEIVDLVLDLDPAAAQADISSNCPWLLF